MYCVGNGAMFYPAGDGRCNHQLTAPVSWFPPRPTPPSTRLPRAHNTVQVKITQSKVIQQT